jgi:hypothetical protein
MSVSLSTKCDLLRRKRFPPATNPTLRDFLGLFSRALENQQPHLYTVALCSVGLIVAAGVMNIMLVSRNGAHPRGRRPAIGCANILVIHSRSCH